MSFKGHATACLRGSGNAPQAFPNAYTVDGPWRGPSSCAHRRAPNLQPPASRSLKRSFVRFWAATPRASNRQPPAWIAQKNGLSGRRFANTPIPLFALLPPLSPYFSFKLAIICKLLVFVVTRFHHWTFRNRWRSRRPFLQAGG